MINLIENSISWPKLGSHPKDEYRYVIERAVLGKYDNILRIQVRLNFVMPFSDVEKIETIAKDEVAGLEGVELHFEYEDIIQTPQEVIGLFIEHMIHIVNGSYAAITKTIFPEKFRMEGGRLIIYALGNTAVDLLNEQVSSKFSKLLMDNFGIAVTVSFENHQETYEQAHKQIIEQEKRDAEENLKNQQMAAQNKPKTT